MKGWIITPDCHKKDGPFAEQEWDNEPSLDDLQRIVGGYIEVAIVNIEGQSCHMIMNEEGKLKGLPLNPTATSLYQETHGPIDVINGTVLLLDGMLA